MASPNNLSRLREQIDWLDGWQASLEERIASAQQELEVVQGLRNSVIEARDVLLSQSASGNPRRITVDDIKHCKTQREVLRVAAQMNGGPAHLGEVAELVVDARMTKSDKDSVRATLYHFVTDNPDNWVHMGNSKVWLLEFGLPPDIAPSEDDESADQADYADGLSYSPDLGKFPSGEEPTPATESRQEMANG